MKNKKTALFMGSLVSISMILGACGNTAGEDKLPGTDGQEAAQSVSTNEANSDDPGSSASGDTAAVREAGGVIDFDEDPYEVTVELVIGRAGELQDEKVVEDAINEITLAKANLTVDLLPVLLAEHATKMSLWSTTGEKVDLVMAGMTTPFNNLVASESLQPITEELNTRAPELVEKLGVLLEPVTVDGEIYAVPAVLYPADSYVFYYNQELADEYGIEVPEVCGSAEDIEKVFEQVKASGMEARATNIGQGVPSSCVLYDSLTSGMNTSQMMKAETIFGEFVREGAVNTLAFAESNVGVTLGKGLLSKTYLANKHVLDYTWGVSINCERPDKCVDLLNLMYTDADVMNLMANGIEGLNYQMVSERIIDYADGLTAATSGYAQLISKIGDSKMVYQFAPLTEDYYDEIVKYEPENADIISPALGFSADVTAVQSEIASITNVVSEYSNSLAYGLVDVDETLPKFRAALKEAGIDKVVTEINRQYQEWKNQWNANV